MKLNWEDFCKEFCATGNIYTIYYNNEKYTIGRDWRKHDKIFSCITETVNRRENYVKLEFGSPQALLENVMLQGKRLAEVWDEVILE